MNDKDIIEAYKRIIIAQQEIIDALTTVVKAQEKTLVNTIGVTR